MVIDWGNVGTWKSLIKVAVRYSSPLCLYTRITWGGSEIIRVKGFVLVAHTIVSVFSLQLGVVSFAIFP